MGNCCSGHVKGSIVGVGSEAGCFVVLVFPQRGEVPDQIHEWNSFDKCAEIGYNQNS